MTKQKLILNVWNPSIRKIDGINKDVLIYPYKEGGKIKYKVRLHSQFVSNLKNIPSQEEVDAWNKEVDEWLKNGDVKQIPCNKCPFKAKNVIPKDFQAYIYWKPNEDLGGYSYQNNPCNGIGCRYFEEANK